jgi:hypothetical protein
LMPSAREEALSAALLQMRGTRIRFARRAWNIADGSHQRWPGAAPNWPKIVTRSGSPPKFSSCHAPIATLRPDPDATFVGALRAADVRECRKPKFGDG